MKVADQAARDRAIDPGGSFCVTAPAGSGKTSLLVQRYLALLCRVQRPESITAITFTRKAAAEMRERVIAALQAATRETSAQGAYQEKTFKLAYQALEHARSLNWELLETPGRLRIQTIDSLCAELSQQMPLGSGSGGMGEVSERIDSLKRDAILGLLQHELARDDQARRSDVQRLLLYLDNSWEQAVELLGRLLDQREQWQLLLANASDDDKDSLLRQSLEQLAEVQLATLREHLRDDWISLRKLHRHRCEKLALDLDWDPELDDLAAWQDLASMLLTKDRKNWRKTVNKNHGFPVDSAQDRENKQQLVGLLRHYAEDPAPGRLNAIQHVLELPLPSSASGAAGLLDAVVRLLPRLAAELFLVFQEAGQNDFTQLALGALQSLGSDEEPTDLALRLDYRLEHLLVDEFQDTSSLQFELLRRLIRGWSEHNEQNPALPRTVFLVGDAQQSIYGFRQANVGLFLEARELGIGDFSLERLDLEVNFRSSAELVTWTNRVFARALPDEDEPHLGAVSHQPAKAARDEPGAVEVALFCGEEPDRSQELERLCDKVAEGMADSSVESIAVLGRSRNVLRPIVRALSERGLAPQAQDLDLLADRQVIRDLVSLCCVLSDPCDRYAWLALMRSPAVALDHADLLALALEIPIPAQLPAAAVDSGDALASLSTEGRERVIHIAKVLAWAEAYRDRLALRVWVEECWLRLGGPASVDEERDLADAERFLSLLPGFEQRREPISRRALERELAQLYAVPGSGSGKLQVMTLHKSKCLEFDWVFLPNLDQ